MGFTGTAKAADAHVEGALFLEHVAGARGLVVEDDVRIERLHVRNLLFGPRASNYLKACGLGQLYSNTEVDDEQIATSNE